MPKKIKLKTKENTKSVSEFLSAIPDLERRKDAKKAAAIMRRVTGKRPKMWGKSIVGYGKYEYTRSNGDFGEFMATGFAPRKDRITFYIMPGYKNFGPLLKKLGPYTKGSSCLHIKRLEDVDLKVIEKIIREGLKDLKKTHKVS